MLKKKVTDIHEILNSNLPAGYVDPFYQRASLDLLNMIVDYVEIEKGIEINNDNALPELVVFATYFKIKEKSGYEIYKDMLSKNQTNSPVALSHMSETTLDNVYSFFTTLLTATLVNNADAQQRILKKDW